MSDINPLIAQGHLLDFAHIAPEHVTPAVKELLGQAGKVLSEVVDPKTPADWAHVVEPLEESLDRLGRAWGAVGHLMAVNDNPQLRAAYNENLPAVTQFYIALSQNEALFAKYKAMKAAGGMQPLQERVIDHEIRDFVLSGADLPADKKARMKALGEESAALSQKFSENLLDATNAFTLDVTDEKRLAGIPEDVKVLYAEQAKAANKTGWRITLQFPSYIPVLQYAQDRSLREELYHAFSIRASELGPKERDNTPIIVKLLTNRAEIAHLLGYHNYAEVSLATKMAKTPQEVLDFLDNLAAKALPYAKKDEEELKKYAAEKLGIEKLEPWDQAYASEKLREERYSYSDNEVKQYFTQPAVLAGLFHLAETLFSIHIEPDAAPVWNPDVKFFRITDKNGKLVAQFYMDLYARASKRGGAWMDNDLTRRRLPDGTIQTPTAYIVCNFARPAAGKPALMTHMDVTTIFHEFGHALHHMLSRVDIEQLSGINGVEWDAVEMPSQFMENWAWEYEVIKTISRHVTTGEVLPRELFDKMLAAKNYHSGLACVRQLEFALFDMRIHSTDSDHPQDFMATLRQVQSQVCVTPVAPFTRFPQSFSHIFAGGYAAGYYSYKWAEVLSADVFSAFEEEGLFNPATGKRWLDEVLSRGSSRDILESFKAFRGREPHIDALLRHSGLTGSTTH